LGQQDLAAVPDLLRLQSREPPPLLFVEPTEQEVDVVVQVPVGMILATNARRTLALVDRDLGHNRHSLGSPLQPKAAYGKLELVLACLLSITATELAMILGGVELGSAKRLPRYEHPAAG
jgi:hypothetical protein